MVQNTGSVSRIAQALPWWLSQRTSVMQALGAEPDIYEKLTASLAPSIWQMEDVKKGVLCQLFGGTTKVRLGAGRFYLTRRR